MGIAALTILGALLAFGAVVITYGLFSASFAVKVLDFLLLVGIFLVAARTSLACFQRRARFPASRMMAIGYGLFLTAATCYAVVELFASR